MSNWIYHYTSADNAIKYILTTKTLKFSKMSQTNDPCESRDNLFDMNKSDRDKLGNEKFWKHQTDFGKLLKKNIKLICFTEDNETHKGYEHPRMWHQYANNGKGVLLKFDKNKLIENMNEAIEAKKNSFLPGNMNNVRLIGEKPVTYSKDFRPNAILFTAEQVEQNKMIDLVNEVINNHSELLFMKNIDWKDENEYRVVIDSEFDFFINIDGCLKEIIYGLNTCDEDKRSIKIHSDQIFTNRPKITNLQYSDGRLSILDDNEPYCDEIFCGEDFI